MNYKEILEQKFPAISKTFVSIRPENHVYFSQLCVDALYYGMLVGQESAKTGVSDKVSGGIGHSEKLDEQEKQAVNQATETLLNVGAAVYRSHGEIYKPAIDFLAEILDCREYATERFETQFGIRKE